MREHEHEHEVAGEATGGGTAADATPGLSAAAALLQKKILRRKAQKAKAAGEGTPVEEAEAHTPEGAVLPPEHGGQIAAHEPGDKSQDLLELGKNAGGVKAAFGGGGEEKADTAPV